MDEVNNNEETYMGTLEPYFEISQNEYNRERDRKQSLETRSGIVITVITALFAYLIKKVNIQDLFSDINKPLTLFRLFQIALGIGTYLSLIVGVWYSYKTIRTAQYDYFDVSVMTPEVLGHQKNKEMMDIIKAYKNIIINHRTNNETKANCLEKSIISVITCVALAFIYQIIF